MPLPTGVRSRMIRGVNGLDVHVLEGGHESPGRPLALLLHGFPDLAYGWRHLIPLLANAGYHVIAPDQRGFGRTTGWVNTYDAPLESFMSSLRAVFPFVESHVVSFDNFLTGGVSTNSVYVARL